MTDPDDAFKPPRPHRRQDQMPRRIDGDLAGDPLLRPLATAFVACLPDRLRRVTKALSAADMETIARVAHDLKTGAGGCGFDTIGRAASDLEQAAAGRSPALRPAASRLLRLCRRAKARKIGDRR